MAFFGAYDYFLGQKGGGKGKGKSRGKGKNVFGSGRGGPPAGFSTFEPQQGGAPGAAAYADHFQRMYELEYTAEKKQVLERTRDHPAEYLEANGQAVSGLKAVLDPVKPEKVCLRFPSPPPDQKRFALPPRGKKTKHLYEALSEAATMSGLVVTQDAWADNLSLKQCKLLTVANQYPCASLLTAGAEVVVAKPTRRKQLPYLADMGVGRCVLVSGAELREVDPDRASTVFAEVESLSRMEMRVKLITLPPLPARLPPTGSNSYRIDAGPNKTAYDRIQGVLLAIKSVGGPAMNLGLLRRAEPLAPALFAQAPQRAMQAMSIKRGAVPSPDAVLTTEAARAAELPARASKVFGKVPAQATWLNATQKRVRAHADERRKLMLVQGPPGTGKTATALEVVCSWLRAGAGPVLATAFSNQGADNLAEGLYNLGVKVVRVGANERDLPCGFDAMFEKYTKKMYYLRESRSESESPKSNLYGKGKGYGKGKDKSRASWDIYEEGSHFEEMVKFLRGCDVVCATCIGVGMSILNAREGALEFPCVAVDEAAQIIEPAVLLPLARGSRQVAMFGDQCQLPATVLSQEAEKLGLGVSMFARLINTGCGVTMLNEQYRMHSAIASYPSAEFYMGHLRDGIDDAERRPAALHPLLPEPVSFVHCDGQEQARERSKANPVEAQCVAFFVDLLTKRGIKWWDIGVITPYAGQVLAIQKELRALNGAGGKVAEAVSSVDAYQGSECEVVLLSMVRANTAGRVGFLADWRRMNVSLTRSKRRCIVVGHLPTLLEAGTTDVWQRWVKHYASRGSGLNVVQWKDWAMTPLPPGSAAAKQIAELAPDATFLAAAAQRPKAGAHRKVNPTRTLAAAPESFFGITFPMVFIFLLFAVSWAAFWAAWAQW